MTFRIVICHSNLSNNCNNIFLPVLSSCILLLLALFSQRSNHMLHCYTRLHQLKTDQYQDNKIKIYQCSKKLVRYKEYSCFDFPAHSIFKFDVFWGSLDTSFFGNSSPAANNSRSRLPSRLSFRFLWLWYEWLYY